MATFAEIVGAELPATAGEDSQSFASILTDPASSRKRVPLINHASNGRFSITDGKWKLILPHKKQQQHELYDLSTDAGETKNLIADQAEVAERLEQKITSIVCDGRSTAGPRQPNDTGYWADLSWMTPDEYEQASK